MQGHITSLQWLWWAPRPRATTDACFMQVKGFITTHTFFRTHNGCTKIKGLGTPPTGINLERITVTAVPASCCAWIVLSPWPGFQRLKVTIPPWPGFQRLKVTIDHDLHIATVLRIPHSHHNPVLCFHFGNTVLEESKNSHYDRH